MVRGRQSCRAALRSTFLLRLLSSRLPSLVDTVDVVLTLLKGIQSVRIQLFKSEFQCI